MSDKKFGPILGGSNDVYKVTDHLEAGDVVRIHIPGLNAFDKEIVMSSQWNAQVEIEGERYFLGDRSNGGDHGRHSWRFQVQEKDKPLPTEPGLYQDLTNGASIENSVTYRVFDGVWHDALNNKPVSKASLKGVQVAHNEGNLVRLVREAI